MRSLALQISKTLLFFACNQAYQTRTAQAYRSQAHGEERATWLDFWQRRGTLILA
jgi:hypothetical protein